MPKTERDRELSRRRTRRAKLKKFRAQYAAAKGDSEKAEILEKARKISPFVELEPTES